MIVLLQNLLKSELGDTFKERIKRRPIIEHKNAEMKRFHGMVQLNTEVSFVCEYWSISPMFVVNVKRMVRLIEQKQSILWRGTSCFLLFQSLFPSWEYPFPQNRGFCMALYSGAEITNMELGSRFNG
ncbi:hypothetical protein PGLA_04620 [Paenibacillus glacialis]|uniref:Transposase DDE domain-containing protein n=1 Tax=Paenibacillus glacialis TaxID=494026 RepID=A0A168MHW4_9BACL|nr:hypothetical protein [Paenibacillus glacialis]OAB44702.1 hypothetical protein PGLA_04620 [Paenibacillus glacialis]